MVPYSYNMVDMGGIDLAEVNGTVVPGVYERITEAMNLCGDVILYNWKFAEINIVPSAYTILQQSNSILINGLIQVTELDQITVIALPPPIVPVSPLEATENGIYEAEPPASGFNPVMVSVPERIPIIEPLMISENGTYYAQEGIDGYSPINVQVGAVEDGFEIYAADASGATRTNFGIFNNSYFICFFDDNMSNNYSLNGVPATYSILATGKSGTGGLKATTRDVTNPPAIHSNALIPIKGSVFTTSHNDNGSYISVVGGWVGYPHGGVIHEAASTGTSISLTLNSIYETLLIFIGASSNSSAINTVSINGITYDIENIGAHYGAYGMYTAIVINENSDTNFTVVFPANCWSYMSIIGLNPVN